MVTHVKHRSHRPAAPPADRPPHHRLVWLATAGMLAGALVAGMGVALLSWALGLAGAVLLLLSGLGAWRAGIMRDTRVKGPGNSLQPKPDTGPGGVPGADSISPAAAAAAHRPIGTRGDAAQWAGVVAACAGAWLVIAHFALPYAFTDSGQDAVLRETALGLLIFCAALPLARSRARRTGPWLLLTGAALVLLLVGLLAGGSSMVRGIEIGTAVAVLLAAAVRRVAGRG